MLRKSILTSILEPSYPSSEVYYSPSPLYKVSSLIAFHGVKLSSLALSGPYGGPSSLAPATKNKMHPFSLLTEGQYVIILVFVVLVEIITGGQRHFFIDSKSIRSLLKD